MFWTVLPSRKKTKRNLAWHHKVQWPGKENTRKRVRRLQMRRSTREREMLWVCRDQGFLQTGLGKLWMLQNFWAAEWPQLIAQNDGAVYFIEVRTPLWNLKTLWILVKFTIHALTLKNPKTIPGCFLNFRSLEVGALPFYNLCRWQTPLVHLRAIMPHVSFHSVPHDCYIICSSLISLFRPGTWTFMVHVYPWLWDENN